MLVCSKCGTTVKMAGHACPACGDRGAIEARFYRGEKPAAPAAEEATEPTTQTASEAGTLPDAERAWSPWLAAVIGLFLGPPAAGFVAASNLRRLQTGAADPWLVGLWLLAGQLLVAVVTGFIGRANVPVGWVVVALFWLGVLVGVVRWQWEPVAAQRQSVPGRHIPGVDAFAAFLVALLLGLAASYAALLVADKLSGDAFSASLQGLLRRLRS